jgi:hypothetical protein
MAGAATDGRRYDALCDRLRANATAVMIGTAPSSSHPISFHTPSPSNAVASAASVIMVSTSGTSHIRQNA